MLSSFIKISFRNILRDKRTSLINILGLSLGLACTCFILIYVIGELSYDQNFTQSENLYRITDQSLGDEPKQWAATPPALSGVIVTSFPEVKEAGRFFYASTQVLKFSPENQPARMFEESEGYYADASIPGMFGVPFLYGDPESALKEINSIVLTRKTAQKYLGTDNPVGQVMENVQDGHQYTVTGVIDEWPRSHIQFDYLISMTTLYASGEYPMESRTWNGFYNYVLLHEKSDLRTVEDKMDDLTVALYSELGMTREEILKAGKLKLQPITSIHLHSDLEKEMGPNGSLDTLYILSTAAILILLLACINFINISTVQSFRRMKEVGIRKAIGTSRSLLVRQFLTESFLVSLISATIVLGLISVSFPLYTRITGEVSGMGEALSQQAIAAILFIALLTGLLSGIYPALFFSSFKPISALKGTGTTDHKVTTLRKSLIVLQFAVAIFMMVCSLVIYSQLHFIQEKDPGFNRHQILSVHLNGLLVDKIQENPETLKERLMNYSHILSASLTSRLPGERFGMGTLRFRDDNRELSGVRYMDADEGFLETMGIKLKDGANFRNMSPDEGTAFIINEKARELLDSDPLGREIMGMENSALGGPIIGIVEDFNFASLHHKVDPLVIQYRSVAPEYLMVKFKGKDVQKVLEIVRKEIQNYAPESMFSYSFLDERINLLYASEQRLGQIFRVFTGMALLISCLGLFGLSAYTTQLRTKEIGIRKILGASSNSIFILLSRQFVKLIVIAIVIGLPPALYFSGEWLNAFVYRTEVQWWIVAVSSFGLLGISLLAISFHTIKSSRLNPVENLRAE